MANYNLKIIDNKVIFDGHAENQSDCHTLTLLCNLLEKNTKTIDYKMGYAEFELDDLPSENKFWLTDLQTFSINGTKVDVKALQATSESDAFFKVSLEINLSFSQNGVTVHNVGNTPLKVYLQSELDLNSYFSITSIPSIAPGGTALLPFLDNIRLRSIVSNDGQNISEGDIVSEDGTKLTVSKIRAIDLTTLPGWASLSNGSHNITIVAKADGYMDSEPSAGVSVTKAFEPPTDCITFIGESSDFTLRASKEWNGTVEYSTDRTQWTMWSGTTISSHNRLLYLRGSGNTTFYRNGGAKFVLSAKAGCSGNIQTLLEYSNPPTTLSTDNTYFNMFNGCTKLTTAPDLPATTLTPYCYALMFRGCTSLTAAPDLPATTLSSNCYDNMFDGCTSLTTAPKLPATTLASACYTYMFSGCTSLTTAPKLPATTLARSCYNGMFSGCTNLTAAPKLPATKLASSANNCYANMFSGCKSLTKAPDLPATTLSQNCYADMFAGCTSLKISATQSAEYPTAWRIPSTGTISSAARDWNYEMLVNTGGTFTSAPSINTTYYGAW